MIEDINQNKYSKNSKRSRKPSYKCKHVPYNIKVIGSYDTYSQFVSNPEELYEIEQKYVNKINIIK